MSDVTYYDIISLAQRTYSMEPQNYTSYRVLTTLSDNSVQPVGRAAVPFECELGRPFYATVRPIITWEVHFSNGEMIEIVNSQPLDVIYGIQFNNKGYLQIYFPNVIQHNDTKVRCISTNPLSQQEKIYSNWARVITLGKFKVNCLCIYTW